MDDHKLSHGIVRISMREGDGAGGFNRVWETKSPAYADRFFEIQAKEIIFGTGEGRFDVYPITKIRIEKEKENQKQKTLYLICYKNIEGKVYKFFFYYDSANQGTIRFKNQKEMVWTKKSLSSASN